MASEQKLDKTDISILCILQEQARITNQDLAASIGLSPSSCLNRVKRLEQLGFIGPYHAVINLHKFCRSVTCIATVTMKNHTQESFGVFQEFVDQCPEIVECYTVSGSFDFFIKIICSDMERYLTLNDEILNSGAKITNLSTHVVMKENKPYSGYPISKLI